MSDKFFYVGPLPPPQARRPSVEDLQLAKALHIEYYEELAEEGTPWEAPASEDPQYFATLAEAIIFLQELPDLESENTISQLAQVCNELKDEIKRLEAASAPQEAGASNGLIDPNANLGPTYDQLQRGLFQMQEAAKDLAVRNEAIASASIEALSTIGFLRSCVLCGESLTDEDMAKVNATIDKLRAASERGVPLEEKNDLPR